MGQDADSKERCQQICEDFKNRQEIPKNSFWLDISSCLCPTREDKRRRIILRKSQSQLKNELDIVNLIKQNRLMTV